MAFEHMFLRSNCFCLFYRDCVHFEVKQLILTNLHGDFVHFQGKQLILTYLHGLLVSCFGLNGQLRQTFSLYRAVSQREREKEKRIDR